MSITEEILNQLLAIDAVLYVENVQAPSFKMLTLLFGTPLWNNGETKHLDKKTSESLQVNMNKTGGKKEHFVNSQITFTFYQEWTLINIFSSIWLVFS